MHLTRRCSFEQSGGMNIMGASVKSDEGIFKSIFVLWMPYTTAIGTGKFLN